MKLRKNILVGLLAGMLALSGVACSSDDGGATDGATDAGGAASEAATEVAS